MPIYVYRCSSCNETFEEIQKLGEVAPDLPTDGCPGNGTCHLERQITAATHRFSSELSSDGIGGYERQGDVMIRQTPGKNSENYGTDRSGKA